MRLWHYKLIPHLPTQWLLGQHRECCALRGLGWRKKHATVDYVFNHNYLILFNFHSDVIKELERRNCKIDPLWKVRNYRGKSLFITTTLPNEELTCFSNYPEHNDTYLDECLTNLSTKGIQIKKEEIQ